MDVTEGRRWCGSYRLVCGDLLNKETLGQRSKWSEEPGMCLKKLLNKTQPKFKGLGETLAPYGLPGRESAEKG